MPRKDRHLKVTAGTIGRKNDTVARSGQYGRQSGGAATAEQAAWRPWYEWYDGRHTRARRPPHNHPSGTAGAPRGRNAAAVAESGTGPAGASLST